MKATFAAGCFWGVESEFRKLKGIKDVTVGYEGGNFENPNYEDVCSGKTNHAEVVEIEYNPDTVSYEYLLNVFWKIHDSTTPNQQGPNFGTQYRSIIFYHNKEQKKIAEKSKKQQQEINDKKISTEIIPNMKFYKAEEYHQNYFSKNKGFFGCRI